VLALLLSALAVPADAEFRANTHDEGYQLRPAVAADAGGDFVVVWTSYLPGAAQPLNSIRGQRFAADGSVVGPEFRVDRLPGDLARNPSVAMSPDGSRFVVVWEGGASIGKTRRRIWARVFGANGQPLGDEIRVEQDRLLSLTHGLRQSWYAPPAVSMAPDGSFVVAWRADGGRSCDRFNITARRYSRDGEPDGDQFLVHDDVKLTQVYPDIGHDAAGGFVVTWQSALFHGTDHEVSSVWARRFAADGEPAGEAFEVTGPAESPAVAPTLAVAPDGRFVVAWNTAIGEHGSRTRRTRSARNDHRVGEGRDVVTLMRSMGKGGPGPVVEVGAGNRITDRPGLAVLPGDAVVVAWTWPDPEHETAVLVAGRMMTAYGHPLSPLLAVSPRTNERKGQPAVAAPVKGPMVVVWQTTRAASIQGLRMQPAAPWARVPTTSPGPTLADKVQELTAKLGSHRVPEERVKAANGLRQLRREAEAAVPQLIESLTGDEDSRVRVASAWALGATADPGQAVSVLVQRLDPQDPAGVREVAVQVLGSLGDAARPAIGELVKLLGDVDEDLRASAAYALARIGHAGALEPLRGLLRDDDPGRRSKAGMGLAELAGEHEEALRVLLRSGSVDALVRIEPVPPEAVSRVAEMLAASIGKRSALSILSRLRLMGFAAASAAPEVVEAMLDENAGDALPVPMGMSQAGIAKGIGISTLVSIDPGSDVAVRALVGLLQDPEIDVRGTAVVALRTMGLDAVRAARDALKRLLEEDQSTEVRKIAEQTLDLLADDRCNPPSKGAY
jgi:HEAT repeat protein